MTSILTVVEMVKGEEFNKHEKNSPRVKGGNSGRIKECRERKCVHTSKQTLAT